MGDSNISSVSMRILNIVATYQPITRKNITKTFFENFSSGRDSFNSWMSKLPESSYMNEKSDGFVLGLEVQPYYHPEIREIWDELRVWKFRKKFYP